MSKENVMMISGTTRLAGVIGCPIKHTLSPAMQNAALQACGIDAVYLPLGVEKNDLKKLIASLVAINALGANVTIPYKEKVLSCLDEVDEHARRIGAVNTIVIKNGKTKGYNTDASGFMTCIKKRIKVKGKTAVLVGGGGAGRAIAMTLIQSGLKELLIVDTDTVRLNRLKKDLLSQNTTCLVIGSQPATDELKKYLGSCHLLVNATPLGLNVSDPLPIKEEWMPSAICVMDIVYSKGLTNFLKVAKKKKNIIIPGWEMLLYQGADAFELWTNQAAPIAIMEKALIKAAGIKK